MNTLLRIVASIVALALAPLAAAASPNVILIVADDLGWGELGCYGQEKIRTPNVDRLAAAGTRFTHFYSGNPVCAPSRCTLLTGLHTGHTFIRNNHEMGGWERDAREGQLQLPAGTVTLPGLLQARGYATAAIGKWGLGGPDTSGAPNTQGFDLWYGYLCQRLAHNYYPEHLWRNGEKIPLGNDYFSAHQRVETAPEDPDGYAVYAGSDYAPDLMADEALRFIREQREGPFFLYYPTPVPHVALQVPGDSLDEYPAEWDAAPYLGTKGYLPHPRPRAAYAAMITRMDRDVGRMLDLLDELEIADDTLVLFTSDNGTTYNGGVDAGFFRSAGDLRGLKGSVFEGGIRVPLVARWPGHVPAGEVNGHVGAFWDLLPTLAEVTGVVAPKGIDGISFAPALLGRDGQREHDVLYWELGGQQAVRAGKWKLVRRTGKSGYTGHKLYDLERDPTERRDLSDERSDVLERLLTLARESRTPSPEFPSVFDDGR